jgi:predicted acetyltransferase
LRPKRCIIRAILAACREIFAGRSLAEVPSCGRVEGLLPSHLSGDIEVGLARLEERAALDRLIQLYIHDFSELWSGTPRGELRDDGSFWMYPLEPYWEEPTRVPLLIRRGGHLAGFALLNVVTHSGRPADRNMAEFFVVRKHRRSGVGRAVAQEIFSRYPGLWEVAVVRPNVHALTFWRGTIGSHPAAREIEETEVASEAWNGPIIRFTIAV